MLSLLHSAVIKSMLIWRRVFVTIGKNRNVTFRHLSHGAIVPTTVPEVRQAKYPDGAADTIVLEANKVQRHCPFPYQIVGT